jgi:hypothetical protein
MKNIILLALFLTTTFAIAQEVTHIYIQEEVEWNIVSKTNFHYVRSCKSDIEIKIAHIGWDILITKTRLEYGIKDVLGAIRLNEVKIPFTLHIEIFDIGFQKVISPNIVYNIYATKDNNKILLYTLDFSPTEEWQPEWMEEDFEKTLEPQPEKKTPEPKEKPKGGWGTRVTIISDISREEL